MSLYQKHRPVLFSDMTGQKHVSQTLQNAIKLDLLAHAYLFCGPRGTGKTTSARILARAVNCLEFDTKTLEPCNKCTSCTAILENSVLDVIEIDAASNRGIDEIRLLKENVGFAPTQVKNKVYIIDEVHMLTNEAFNALLKTLEEPPSNVFFILATTEVHKIPETIISRCQRFNFERLSVADIVSRLEYICGKENIKFTAEGLTLVAEVSKGGMRDSISLLDQIQVSGEISFENVNTILGKTEKLTIEKLYESMSQNQAQESLEILDSVYNSGFCLMQFSEDFMLFLRGLMYNDIETNFDRSLKVSKLISLFYDLKQRFNDSGLIKSTLEVFIIQGIGVLVGGTNSLVDSKSSAKTLQTNLGGAKLSDSTPSPIDAKTLSEISLIKSQTANLQTLIDKHAIELQSQLGLINALKSEVAKKPAPEVDSALQLTPMLDSALQMIEEESKQQEDTTKSKVYSKDFDLSEVQKLFPKWHKKINTSSVKRALNQATFSEFDTQTLGIGFNSNFLIKTIDKPEVIDEIERAIATEYRLIKVKPVLGSAASSNHAGLSKKDPFALDESEMALRSAASNNDDLDFQSLSSTPEISNENDMADFFDGEIV